MGIVPKSLVYKETGESETLRGHQDWEPEWISYVFTAWAKCNNPSCGNKMVISGIGGEEERYDGEENSHCHRYFAPRFCAPMPDIFDIPAKCPKEVTNELRGGFALFFADSAATANRMRSALERLMDHLGVISGKLHDRLDAFAKKNPIGENLMAIKWLGNTGSHEGKVSRDDILDGFLILEHALSELIEERTAKATQLARKLTNKHKPPIR